MRAAALGTWLPSAVQAPPRTGTDLRLVSSLLSELPLPRRSAARAEPVELDALVQSWRAGDDGARDVVLHEVRRRTLRYLSGLRVPPHECEDLAQEVCLGVLDAAPTWPGPLWPLVFTIVRNKSVDRVRRSTRGAILGHSADSVELALAAQADTAAGPEDLAVLGDAATRMRALLTVLPPTQRDVLLLRVVVGLTVAETATALGLKHGSVHVLQHRACAPAASPPRTRRTRCSPACSLSPRKPTPSPAATCSRRTAQRSSAPRPALRAPPCGPGCSRPPSRGALSC